MSYFEDEIEPKLIGNGKTVCKQHKCSRCNIEVNPERITAEALEKHDKALIEKLEKEKQEKLDYSPKHHGNMQMRDGWIYALDRAIAIVRESI